MEMTHERILKEQPPYLKNDEFNTLIEHKKQKRRKVK